MGQIFNTSKDINCLLGMILTYLILHVIIYMQKIGFFGEKPKSWLLS